MGWGGYRNEPVVRPADFGRPDHRPLVRPAEMGRPRPPQRILAENLADTTARWFGRPNHRRVFWPRTTAEPHHRFIPMSSHWNTWMVGVGPCGGVAMMWRRSVDDTVSSSWSGALEKKNRIMLCCADVGSCHADHWTVRECGLQGRDLLMLLEIRAMLVDW